jgi:predicted AlkP superfamily pyrophosphatase or phosphodiesterase
MNTKRLSMLALALAAALAGGTIDATGAHEPLPASAPQVDRTQVLAISIDGLNPTAIRQLGRERTPTLHRLLRRGAGTLNARTQVEQTVTLPNHTSMVTGRRISAQHNGHGVTWNEDLPGTTVHEAAGEIVGSVFTAVHNVGGRTALFSTKAKFSLFDRSWPDSVDRSVIKEGRDAALVRVARRDLVARKRSFRFLHLGLADATGHAHGWMSKEYLAAVESLDHLVGTLLRTITEHDSLKRTVVVLTADHGGVPGTKNHSDVGKRANYRVPFVIWGAGVSHGDLYEMNPTYADPGREQVGFKGTQPIRNGDVANLTTDLLGIPAVSESRWNADQELSWRD